MKRKIAYYFVTVLTCQALFLLMLNTIKAADEKKIITGPSKEQIEVTMRREFTYGLVLHNGNQYQVTFSPPEINTLYMVASTKNVITANHTNVYFWEPTREYMADWSGYNQNLEGTLVILRGNRMVARLTLQKFVIMHPDGYQAKVSEILVGQKALKAFQVYQSKIDAYSNALERYYQASGEYQKRIAWYIKNPGAFGNKPPIEPKPPEAPREYLFKPSDGFIIRLSPGVYRLQMYNKKGELIPNSERKLVSFQPTGRGIGYEIIPEYKWTFPTQSSDLSENIFALQNKTFYFKPFREVQYNTYHYAKLSQLTSLTSGRGMENQQTWVHLDSLTTRKLYLEIAKNGHTLKKIQAKPYYVRQRPGSALGYDIVQFKETTYPGAEPSFIAFKVEAPKDSGKYDLHLVDEHGNSLSGSRRNLRTVHDPGIIFLILIGLTPMLIGIAVIGNRMFRKMNLKCNKQGNGY